MAALLDYGQDDVKWMGDWLRSHSVEVLQLKIVTRQNHLNSDKYQMPFSRI